MNRKTPSATGRLALAALLAVLLGVTLAAGAFAQSAAGTLAGQVQDKNGAVLPGVTVTAAQKDTGFARTVVTGSDGKFRIPTIPVGTYAVKAELQGFGTVTVDAVQINVASERSLEITLNPSTVQESITVVDEAPLIATSPVIGAVVSQEELQNLPLNGRQFANLAVLAPGTTLGYNTDPTKPGQLVVQLNGGSGRNVNYTIDGGDNTDDTIGGALQNFSIEGVQEFKIQTQQYKAEYGRTTGGVLSVVTKSGTNHFAGSAYGFFRDDSLDTKTETEKALGADKQSLDRKQYGGSLGGPIVQDLVHFFATYEKTDRKTNYTVGTDGLFPDLDGKSFPVPFKDELGTAKLTFDPTPKQYLQVRYGYQKNSDKYGQSPLATPNSLGTIANDYKSLLASHTYLVSADSLNEILFQYTHFENTISADSNLPSIVFPNGVVSGQNINTPQSTTQTKYQYKDDFSLSRDLGGRRNDFKVGFNYVHEPVLEGDFTVGTNGQFTALNSDINSPITDITYFGGFSGQKTPVNQYSGYVQDDVQVTDRLTVNLGLRYDYWAGFDLDQRNNPIWQALSTQTKYNESYLRDFQGGQGGQLKNDKNNWAPRLGFAWDVKGDGKQIVRGGYGIYYDFPYTNATILFPAGAVQSNYGVVYNVNNPTGIRNPDGSFFHPGQPLPPNTGSQVQQPNEIASPTIATPNSKQGSLGYSWQVNNWLGVNVDAVNIGYSDIPYRFRANPIDPATGQRRFPQFNNFRLWMGNGTATYNGINLGFKVRNTEHNFELQGFYTLSKAEGDVLAGADEFRLTAVEYQPDLRGGRDVSVNPLNPTCNACRGPLNTDARHRVTIGGLYHAPYGINLGGTFRYHSALPYLEHAGDLNGDGFALDLPPGVSHVNNLRGASFEQFDMRVSKDFTFTGGVGFELIAEMFNVFNAKNPAGFIGDINAPNFGQATTFAGDPGQGEQRLIQLGVRVHVR